MTSCRIATQPRRAKIELYNYKGVIDKVLMNCNLVIKLDLGFNLPPLYQSFKINRVDINKNNIKNIRDCLNDYINWKVTVISTKKQDEYYAEILLKNEFSLNSFILLTINR